MVLWFLVLAGCGSGLASLSDWRTLVAGWFPERQFLVVQRWIE